LTRALVEAVENLSVTTRISVIVCTFNRCGSLVDTLESLNAMEVPEHIDWDVLVVDNNSTDQTRECVEMAARKSRVSVKYLLERKPGQSHARNLGIASTDKEFIAFTDDDVLVNRDWLKTIVDTFETYGADCVGGKIIPQWSENRPSWLGDNLLNVLAMLDFGDTLFEFDPVRDQRILFGANFAFRRQALIRTGAFNVKLGKTGDFGGGEDKEMFEKLRLSGGKAVYNPAIVVLHKVFPDRLKKTYFRKWHYAAGKDRAQQKKKSRYTFLGIEAHLFVGFGKAAFGLVRSVAKADWNHVFSHELQCILYLSVFKHKVLSS
jgi:glucosyl-dolichyl phosphate glucuronosyltransferase